MSTAQIALRDKEEALVHSALARIRRAQERGKSEVNLRQEEVAALERRRKRMQSAATASKSRKGSGSSGGSGSERKRRPEHTMVTVPIVQPDASRPQARHRGNRVRERAESPRRPVSAAPGPGIVVEGPEGASFAPIGGYYPPSSSSNRSSPTRPRSSSSHQSSRRTPPQTSYQKPPSNRHVSEGTRPPPPNNVQRVALPHEEDWVPASRSRRSSISSQPYGYDPFEYQTSGPPPSMSQYAYAQGSSRRYVSGPPEVQYSSLRRSPPAGSHPPSGALHAAAASASDPTLDRRNIEVIEIPDSESESSSEDEDTSDDTGNGVAVKAVEPPRNVSAVPARKPVGGGRKRPRRS